MDYMEQYKLWCKKVLDESLRAELAAMAGDEAVIEEAFFKDLDFGTAGLRGIIGAGTNRMNVHTVSKASQGLANYLHRFFYSPSVAIGYDSRLKSDVFAQISASVLAANGVKVYLWPQLMPVPALSFAVRALNTSAGIVVTASHNPSQYNGYKVYGTDGCQITANAADAILHEIEKVDIFSDVKTMDFDKGIDSGMISYIEEEIYENFIEAVKGQSVLFEDEVNKDVSIVYSPLNGSGLKPVLRTLKESGYTNITVVSEQELPDGNFPTCPYPNPEMKEAMALGIEYAQKYDADLLLATDPDCDRIGIAVKDAFGEMVLLTGNETGLLLLDYICSQRIKHEQMPDDPVIIKSFVTSDMAESIADFYGVRTMNLMTGFKYIGEQIGCLEANGKSDSYIFGFEESYGYLSGAYVRDKDAVGAALLICEMFAYYKSRDISLLEKLEALYVQFGYHLNKVTSYQFEGVKGLQKMNEIMTKCRGGFAQIGSKKVRSMMDYAEGINDLPKSNVLKYVLEDECSVIIRPSGTEPKLKVYISISAEDKATAVVAETEIKDALDKYFA